ncbi:hypothetical protein BCV70DRAFT_205364 [Testicularia cyperi]|uniref:CLASP N-terminal domain-containing protein n=1 Tax=Testicularia cyperi TaxID=1882483 RepID=A0A317XUN5_9BASI|nr:hypothetical protein BCV70DRAFT_205364 [Testicularia cyperi]
MTDPLSSNTKQTITVHCTVSELLCQVKSLTPSIFTSTLPALRQLCLHHSIGLVETLITAPSSCPHRLFITVNGESLDHLRGVGEEMPRSSKQSQEAKISINSSQELDDHFYELQSDLLLPETEHTWQKIEKALARLQALTRGGAFKYANFVPHVKHCSQPINNSLLSERTILSGTAGDLLNSIAPRLAESFDALVPIFVPTLLLICARTNKIAVKRAEKSLHLIIKHCRLASVIPLLREAIKDKGQGLRAVAANAFTLVLELTERDRLSRRVVDVELAIKSGATDSNPEVRQATRRIFELYIAHWPERVEHFTRPLTPTIRRYLSLPKAGALHVDVPPPSSPPPTTAASSSAHSDSCSRRNGTQHEAAATALNASVQPCRYFAEINSTSHKRQLPVTGVNATGYTKAGLFAEQIAAARPGRLTAQATGSDHSTRQWTDYTATTAKPIGPLTAHDRKLQQHHASANPHPASSTSAYQMPRFDVPVRERDADRNHSLRIKDLHHHHADYDTRAAATQASSLISGLFAAPSNAPGPSTTSQGKSALFAAFQQAFAPESLSTSASEHQLKRSKSARSMKDGRNREGKTVSVRFEPKHLIGPETEAEVPASNTNSERRTSEDTELGKSSSAPELNVDQPTASLEKATKQITPASSTKEARSDLDVRDSSQMPQDLAPSDGIVERTAKILDQHSKSCTTEMGQNESGAAVYKAFDVDEAKEITRRGESPGLGPRTPGQPKKASRVMIERAAPAPKVSARRVAVPTPSAKVAANRTLVVGADFNTSTPLATPAPPKREPEELDQIACPGPADLPTRPDVARSEPTRPQKRTIPLENTKTATKKVAVSSKRPALQSTTAANQHQAKLEL